MSSAIKQGEAKHTPGPWECGLRIPGRAPRWNVASVGTFGGYGSLAGASCKWHVAVVCAGSPSADGEVTAEANARLIAAAPDLLAACKALADRFESRVSEDTSRYPELAAARAAITKATT